MTKLVPYAPCPPNERAVDGAGFGIQKHALRQLSKVAVGVDGKGVRRSFARGSDGAAGPGGEDAAVYQLEMAIYQRVTGVQHARTLRGCPRQV